MRFDEYMVLAMRTNDGKSSDRLEDAIIAQGNDDVGGIINACLGLSGEVGELTDMIKKQIFHGHELDRDHISKEISDVMWYLALMCHSYGFSMEKIAQMNIDKLRKRYPDGFSEYASQHRGDGDI